jgi:hypothetical protein
MPGPKQGEASYSGKKMMTKYTRARSGGWQMKVSGRKETSNGRAMMKGMAKRTTGRWGSTGI